MCTFDFDKEDFTVTQSSLTQARRFLNKNATDVDSLLLGSSFQTCRDGGSYCAPSRSRPAEQQLPSRS